MNRSRRIKRPLTAEELKKNWKVKKINSDLQSESQSDKKVRTYNQHSYGQKGKIKLDPTTWVEYDYTGDQPTTKIKKTDGSDGNVNKIDSFKLPKYPTLHSIVYKSPHTINEKMQQMDLYLIKNSDQAIMFKNGELEFYSE
tara:strand:+ start:121 stop:543 length:423 start_codon:yes stop_codon:yes gene_type:complete